jgi:hypothetical protein
MSFVFQNLKTKIYDLKTKIYAPGACRKKSFSKKVTKGHDFNKTTSKIVDYQYYEKLF